MFDCKNERAIIDDLMWYLWRKDPRRAPTVDEEAMLERVLYYDLAELLVRCGASIADGKMIFKTELIER